MNTQWCVTIKTEDEVTIHALAPHEEDLDELYIQLVRHFGQTQTDARWELHEVPLTWECNGEDGCLVMA